MTVLLLIKGHPGSGKSTLARSGPSARARQRVAGQEPDRARVTCRRAISSALGWPLIDKDDARECLHGLDAGSADLNALSYEARAGILGVY